MKAKQPKASAAVAKRYQVRAGYAGGTATAANMTPAQRQARARSAGTTTLKRYGAAYYSDLAKAAVKARKKNAS